MKMSEIMLMPRKSYISIIKYTKNIALGLRIEKPGPRIQLIKYLEAFGYLPITNFFGGGKCNNSTAGVRFNLHDRPL